MHDYTLIFGNGASNKLQLRPQYAKEMENAPNVFRAHVVGEKTKRNSHRPFCIKFVFEKSADLFLRLDLTSTLIRHESPGAIRKRSSNWMNLETPA